MIVVDDEKNRSNLADLPLVEKYRPKNLNDIISHTDIVETIKNFVDSQKLTHLLLHGPAGTGKTSCAISIANMIYEAKDLKQMILELNASDNRGIDVVREDIKTFCSASSMALTRYKFKMVILDEADMMTGPAQAALRRVIEKFTRNVRFILICNQVSKIIPAVQSRCLRFRYPPLKPEFCLQKVTEICDKEKYQITGNNKNQVLTGLIEAAKGDMRKVLNMLESTALAFNNVISEENIYTISGRPSKDNVKSIIDCCKTKEFDYCFKYVFAIKQEKGFTINDLVEQLLNVVLETIHTKGLDLKTKTILRLQKIDYSYKIGGSEKLLIGNLVSAIREYYA